MFRYFVSFSKPTYEKLHRMAKLDILKLNDSKSGNQTLDLYEKYLSSSTFFPEPTLIDQIQFLKGFEAKPIDPNGKNAENSNDEDSSLSKVPNLALITNLLKSKKFEQIKSILSNYHYSEHYYPVEHRSLENFNIVRNISQIFEILNFHIEELEISGWLKIIEFIQYHINTYKHLNNFSIYYDNIIFRKKKIVDVLQRSNLIETCKFINKAKSISFDFKVTPEMNFFLLSQNKSALDELNDLDLLNVLIAYPIGKDLDHARYFPRFIKKYDLIPMQYLIELMAKMKEYNYKIPIRLINKVDIASLYLFYDISSEKVLYLIKKFIHIDILSFEIMKQACNALMRNNISESNQKLILFNFFQLLNESKYFHLLVRNQQVIYNIVISSSQLDTHQHLTIISKLIHHLKDYTVLDSLIEKLKDEEDDFKVRYFNDIIKAQKEFLEFSQELPIFQYQFYSFKVLENELIKTVAKMLNDMIYKVNPYHDLVYQYYYSLLSDGPTPPELLETIKPGNIYWAKLLWHKKDTTNCSKIAESALKLSAKINNPEYLYYLTSIFPVPLNLSSLPESDFSLALSYNISNSPSPTQIISEPQSQASHPSHPSHPSIIQFTNLPTEATMKTIIKLIELNEQKHIKAAIEFISFIPDNHPKFSSKLIKDLFKALAEINPSLIRAQSIKVHLMKAAQEFSSEDLKQISRFLIYLPKNIIYEFKENFNVKGKLFEHDDEENIDKSKKFFEKFKEGKLSENLVHELKVVDFLDYACRDFILKVLDNEGYQDDENMILKVILEILGNTAPDQEIQEKVVQHINKQNLWDSLNFQDLCNFCLVHSKFKIFLPTYVNERFISMIYAKINLEEKYRHPINKLICMKPFKYTTQLEPRVISSNDIRKKQISPSPSASSEIPYHEVENNIKALAYMNTLNLPRTPDLTESVRLYSQRVNSDNELLNNKLSILEDLSQLLSNAQIQENKIDASTGWMQDFYIESEGLSIKLLHKHDYYITSNFKHKLKHLTQLMISQLKQSTRLVCIRFEEWNKLTQEEKQKIISHKN